MHAVGARLRAIELFAKRSIARKRAPTAMRLFAKSFIAHRVRSRVRGSGAWLRQFDDQAFAEGCRGTLQLAKGRVGGWRFQPLCRGP